MKTTRTPAGLAATAAAALAVIALPAWTPARAQATPTPTPTPTAAATVTVPTKVMIKRVFTRADGKSTMDEVELPRVSGGDGRSVGTRLYATDIEMGISSPGSFMDWHGVTTPRLLMVLEGALEIGLGDGTLQVLKPGNIVLVMDTGRGHTSRSIGTVPVSALTLRLPKDDPLKPKLNTCPPNVVAANCVANGVVVTRPHP